MFDELSDSLSHSTSVRRVNLPMTFSSVAMGAIFKADWLPTKVDDAFLEDCVKTGNLDPKEVIGWRSGLGDEIPNPKEGEIVVFAEHLERGFKPPGSKFLRDAMAFMNVRLQDLAPTRSATCASFKYSVKLTCEWNHQSLCFGTSSI